MHRKSGDYDSMPGVATVWLLPGTRVLFSLDLGFYLSHRGLGNLPVLLASYSFSSLIKPLGQSPLKFRDMCW